MTTITISTNLKAKEIELLFRGAEREAVFAQASALRATARKGRQTYVRKMAAKLGIAQRPIRKRSNFYAKKAQLNKNQARAKIWVGLKARITAEDSPKVRARFKGRLFAATMPGGFQGEFYRLGKSRLPIARPALTQADDGPAILRAQGEAAMRGTYPKQLGKEYERRLRRIRKRKSR